VKQIIFLLAIVNTSAFAQFTLDYASSQQFGRFADGASVSQLSWDVSRFLGEPNITVKAAFTDVTVNNGGGLYFDRSGSAAYTLNGEADFELIQGANLFTGEVQSFGNPAAGSITSDTSGIDPTRLTLTDDSITNIDTVSRNTATGASSNKWYAPAVSSVSMSVASPSANTGSSANFFNAQLFQLTPEPSAALLGSVFGGLMFLRRRR